MWIISESASAQGLPSLTYRSRKGSLNPATKSTELKMLPIRVFSRERLLTPKISFTRSIVGYARPREVEVVPFDFPGLEKRR